MIVVTGVHRSGTSLVAMLMEALGADFGPRSAFYPADEWNARGYFERRDVMDINSRIVTGFSRSSGKIRPLLSQLRYLSMPSPSLIRRRGRRLGGSVRALASKLGSLAVKDPRFCLTLGVWNAEGNVAACVVCIRHPTEVAESLRRRQRVPMALGYRFWDYHVAALLESIPQRTLVVDHGTLHGPDPLSELTRLSAFLGGPAGTPALEDAFGSVFSPELRHAGRGDGPRAPPARTQAFWDQLRALRS